MLKDLNKIKGNYSLSLLDDEKISDFKLPDTFLRTLQSDEGLKEKKYIFNEYTSAKEENGNPSQFAIFPNIYFSIIGELYGLIQEVKKYTDIYENLRGKEKFKKLDGNYEDSKRLFNDKNFNNFFPSNDDVELFSRFIEKKKRNIHRLGGKNIFGDKGPRLPHDIFGSVLLNFQNMPNASSEIFGKLAFDLSKNKKLLNQCRALNQDIIVSKNQREFVYEVLKFLSQNNQERKLFDRLEKTKSPKNTYNLIYNDMHIESFVIIAECKLTKEELESETNISENYQNRFQHTPIESEGKFYYATTQLTYKAGKARICLDNFSKIFNAIYDDYKIFIPSKNLYKLQNNSFDIKQFRLKTAINKIYVGAPGVGKSYKIDELTEGSSVIRAVFHAETQNSDFIGCLKPSMDENDRQKIIYSFKPGPFTEALIKATLNKEENHWLVIEEINRASAATVFGEIFQLLDRNAEGESDYGIKLADTDMISYLNQETDNSFPDGEIKIPKNLSLIASMNSSDQAVMPMDTAFKRRWQFEYIPIDLDSNQCSQGNITINFKDRGSKEIKWQIFAKTINEILSKERIPEDKHLGQFFLSQEELKPENQENSLTGKVFIYLWDDVLKHRQSIVFKDDITTFGKLIQQYKEDGIVFSEDFYRILAKFSDSESHQDINVGEKDELAPKADDQ